MKFKTERTETFVIGGNRPGVGRDDFESLLVGYADGEALRFCGMVEAGFTPFQRRAVMRQLAQLRTPVCPFANLPQRSRGRWGSGITADEMSRCVWLKPKVRAEIRFVEWTNARHLRRLSGE